MQRAEVAALSAILQNTSTGTKSKRLHHWHQPTIERRTIDTSPQISHWCTPANREVSLGVEQRRISMALVYMEPYSPNRLWHNCKQRSWCSFEMSHRGPCSGREVSKDFCYLSLSADLISCQPTGCYTSCVGSIAPCGQVTDKIEPLENLESNQNSMWEHNAYQDKGYLRRQQMAAQFCDIMIQFSTVVVSRHLQTWHFSG